MKSPTWKTKDGRIIKIKDMETSHIYNCIKLLEKIFDKHHQDTINVGYSVLSMLQGEMATYYCEQDINRLEREGPEYPEIYWKLKYEFDERIIKRKQKLLKHLNRKKK